MPDWMQSVAHTLELAVGWIFSPSWLPPKDFEFLRWLIVPGYGYGFLLIGFALAEFLLPAQKRPWNRATLLSTTYLLLAGKMGVYTLVVTPLIRKGWLMAGLPSLHLDQTMPLALYMPLAILVATFTAYWSHRLMHRIPILWNFHKVHHATTNLSFSSVFQMHILEYFVHTPLHLTAVLLLGTDLVAPFGVIFMAVDFLAHANIRIDLGRLTYVLCTPQAHRVHHSVDPRHYDTNFGNTFMLWDHVFGTFHYDPKAMPEAYGVTEELPLSFVKQQVLPVVSAAKEIGAGVSRFFNRRQDTVEAGD